MDILHVICGHGHAKNKQLQYCSGRATLGSKEGVEEGLASNGSRRLFLFLLLQLTEQFLSAEDLGVRVQAEENSLVDQGVLLLCPGSFLDLGVGGTDDGLDFGAVDETGDIGVGDLGGRKDVILLEDGRAVKGSKDLVEKGESTLCPDDEAAKMTTRGELEEIESLDAGEFDTGEVAECLYDAVVFAVDDERAAALAVATVAHLSLSGAECARV